MSKIQGSFILPQPPGQGDTIRLFGWAADLVRVLSNALSVLSQGITQSLGLDGTQAMIGPMVLVAHIKTELPAAATWTGGLIYVTDEAGGAIPAFSDGANWRRVTDRAVVS